MSETPETGIEESDPNADSPEGLGGGMGLSSERPGTVRGGAEEVTYTAAPTHTDEGSDGETDGEPAPEQSADDERPEINPDSPGAHESDPDRNPRHGV